MNVPFICEGRNCSCVDFGDDTTDWIAVIEVPLSDGTTVYLEQEYFHNGNVNIHFERSKYEFYPIQFKKHFKDWFGNLTYTQRSNKFLGGKIYTLSKGRLETDDDGYRTDTYVNHRLSYCQPKNIKTITTLTKEILDKCIRVDHDLELPSETKEELITRIENATNDIKSKQESIKNAKEELKNMKAKLKEMKQSEKKLKTKTSK